ncbi:MAG: M48 family metallopeptidase [Candidatus Eisenbacteria bacterium]
MFAIVVLGLALIAPVALLAWARQNALGGRESDSPGAWFAFAQRAQWATLLVWFGWLPAFHELGAGRPALWRGLTPGLPWPVFLALGYLLPPALMSAWSSWVTHQVSVRLRFIQTTRRQAIEQACLRFLAVLGPWGLVLCAFQGSVRGGFPFALACGTGAVALAVLIGARQRRATGITPHAVTRGELRDRVFALAERAGVRMRQFYVVPLTRVRMANAFAVRGDIVILTDYLLAHLDRDEVDAALAHEMTHLRLGHPRKLGLALLAPLMVGVATAPEFGGVPWIFAVAATSFVVFCAVSRRFEWAADAGAIELGARPTALITALAKLNRLNHVPVRWSRGREWLLTHPSTERRALAIAARADMPVETARALIEAALRDTPAPIAEPPALEPVRSGTMEASPVSRPAATGIPVVFAPGTRYEMPVSLRRDKVFSTPFKTAFLQRFALVMLAVSAGTPALLVSGFHALAAGSLARPWMIAITALATTACYLVVLDRAAAAPHRKLRRALTERLRADGLTTDDDDTLYVGLAPDETPRVYEGFGAWDVGLLDLRPGRMDYLGEETRFTLAVEDVTEVVTLPGVPGWFPIVRVGVRWRRPDGLAGSFVLTPSDISRLAAARGAGRALRERVLRWQRTPVTATSRRMGPWHGPPPTTAVTSVSPRAALRPAAFVAMFVVQSLLVSLLCYVLRVPWMPVVGPGVPDAIVAAALGYGAALLPILTWREPPAPRLERDEPVRRAA